MSKVFSHTIIIQKLLGEIAKKERIGPGSATCHHLRSLRKSFGNDGRKEILFKSMMSNSFLLGIGSNSRSLLCDFYYNARKDRRNTFLQHMQRVKYPVARKSTSSDADMKESLLPKGDLLSFPLYTKPFLIDADNHPKLEVYVILKFCFKYLIMTILYYLGMDKFVTIYKRSGSVDNKNNADNPSRKKYRGLRERYWVGYSCCYVISQFDFAF
jgi:hypothetical protein